MRTYPELFFKGKADGNLFYWRQTGVEENLTRIIIILIKTILKKLSPEMIKYDTLAGEKIEAKLSHTPANGAPIGGIKVKAQNGWFASRPSSTEDIYKIYTESFKNREHLLQIQEEAREIVSNVFKAAGVLTED